MALRLLHYSDLENAYDHPDRVGRLAGLVDARRDGETLVVGTGDNLAPGVLSLVTRGRQALDFFEAVRPDAETPGNHDFDHGLDAAREVIGDSPQPWLCANVFEDGERFAAEAGLEPWTVVERGGHRVGLVGVLDPATPEMNPLAEPLTFTDPVEAVADAAATLRDRGVEYVVVLGHLGTEAEVAADLDVDAVLGGHAHDPLLAVVDGTAAARPGANGTHLVEVVLGAGEPSLTRHAVEDAPLDESVADALRDRKAATGLTETVATAETTVPRDYESVVVGESRVGNLVTDAYRWATGADLAVHTPGGIREGPPLDGAVTAADLVGTVPFGGELLVVRLDGAAVLETLRELSITYRHPDASRAIFGHLSGGELAWDDDADDLREATVGGEPVDPGGSYTLATSGYYVETDHLLSAFGPDEVVERHGLQYEALVEYGREVGVDPSVEGRIRRPAFDPDETDLERPTP